MRRLIRSLARRFCGHGERELREIEANLSAAEKRITKVTRKGQRVIAKLGLDECMPTCPICHPSMGGKIAPLNRRRTPW